MQNRPPAPGHPHLFLSNNSNRKGKGRQLPSSVTDASRGLVPPPPPPQPLSRGLPVPPPPPLPLGSTSAQSPSVLHASGSGLGGPPAAHVPWPAPNQAAQAAAPFFRGVARRAVPALDVSAHVTAAMKRLATITQQQQDRDVLQRAYDWPASTPEERATLNDKLADARQEEMRDVDKGIEAEYSHLTTEVTSILAAMVENFTNSRVQGLLKECEQQRARIEELEKKAAAAAPPGTTVTDESTDAVSGVAAAQQQRIDDLERKLNRVLQTTQHLSTSPGPTGASIAAAASARPRGYSPPVHVSSPPGTPFDHPSGSASSASSSTHRPDLHATMKEVRDKYRLVGLEVRKQESQLGSIKTSVADQTRRLDETGQVVQDLVKRLEKLERALLVPPRGIHGGTRSGDETAGPISDPRVRPTSTSPSATCSDVQNHAADVAALRTDLDVLTSHVSSHLGKRPRIAGDDETATSTSSAADPDPDAGPDQRDARARALAPPKAAKRAEGSTPSRDGQIEALPVRMRDVETRSGRGKDGVEAARAGVGEEGGSTRGDEGEAFRERRLLVPRAAPPPSSTTSDMDLDKSDNELERAPRLNAAAAAAAIDQVQGKDEDKEKEMEKDKLDVLERRIQQMDANGSPELLVRGLTPSSLIHSPACPDEYTGHRGAGKETGTDYRGGSADRAGPERGGGDPQVVR